MAAEIGTHRTILGVDEAVSSEVKNSAAQAGRVRRLVDPARDGVGVIGRVGAAPRLARDDKAMPEAEKLLKQLQGRIRAKPKGDSLHLNDSDVSIAAKTRKSLEDDMRYEHVDNLAVALDDFILRCHQDRSTDQGFQFERMHAKAPETHDCYVGIDYLGVSAPMEILGIRLLPMSSPEIPRFPPPESFDFEPTTGAVAVIETRGTDRARMAERAKEAVRHFLRVLRVTLRDSQGINDKQLRFRVGRVYRFDDLAQGWSAFASTPYAMPLDESARPLIEVSPIATLPAQPTNDAERHANIAMAWMERSRLEGDPLVALLHLFTALEALVGTKDEEKKAPALAFRAAILSHLVDGRFTHPVETLKNYADIRSVAIHGGEVREPITEGDVAKYERTVRWALRQYVLMIRQHGFSKKIQLIRLLDAPEQRRELAEWIRREAPDPAWNDYLSEVEVDSDN
jgi:hypothetical protein